MLRYDGAEDSRGLHDFRKAAPGLRTLAQLRQGYPRDRIRVEEITHQVIDLVNKVFITPVDREGIQVLVKTMDDVTDRVNSAAQCMQTYEIQSVLPGLGSMAHVLRPAMQEIGAALQAMETLRRPEQTLRHCIEVNRLENECDRIIREQVARLFREHKDDPLLVIKYKEIYETIEAAVDCCEDVANVIEAITIKHS